MTLKSTKCQAATCVCLQKFSLFLPPVVWAAKCKKLVLMMMLGEEEKMVLKRLEQSRDARCQLLLCLSALGYKSFMHEIFSKELFNGRFFPVFVQ